MPAKWLCRAWAIWAGEAGESWAASYKSTSRRGGLAMPGGLCRPSRPWASLGVNLRLSSFNVGYGAIARGGLMHYARWCDPIWDANNSCPSQWVGFCHSPPNQYYFQDNPNAAAFVDGCNYLHVSYMYLSDSCNRWAMLLCPSCSKLFQHLSEDWHLPKKTRASLEVPGHLLIDSLKVSGEGLFCLEKH